MELTQDWHIHTHRSKCGQPDNTVAAIVRKLDARGGLQFAGISDHINVPEEGEWFIDVIAQNRRDLEALTPACRVLIGTEATMLDPATCALDAELAAGLDFVLVACNHYHLDVVENPAEETSASYADHYLDMVAGALELGFVDAVTHPFLHDKLGPATAPDILAHYDEGRLADLLREAARRGVAFELNPYRVRYAMDWFRELVQEGRRQGTQFALGSDAHNLAAVAYPVEGGCVPETLFDALGLKASDLKWPRGIRPASPDASA
ncbi:MAG: hypothetical protein JXR94_19385 [Candidatus Hydrogenedentes bacterium]|nr:hypothetical protein [Candidatus Hydrogenedentota bacterium]